MNALSWRQALLSAVFATVTAPASAVVTVLNSGGLIPGTIWDVSFPSWVQLLFNDADKTNGTAGTLIEITSRAPNDNSSITLTFNQDFEIALPPAGQRLPRTLADNGGLRLNLQKTDTNNSDDEWVGYRLQLIDGVPVANKPDSADHPPQPHFHPRPGIATTPATFVFGETFTGDQDKFQGSFLGAANRTFPDTIVLGNNGKTVLGGRSMQVLNLLLHERQFPIGDGDDRIAGIPDPGRRNFELIETPLLAPAPEPATLWLSALGAVALAWRTRRRR